MQIVEKLQWILDGTSKKAWDDEENGRRIAFVHSLGLKCDSVGWCKLDLADPESDGVLECIRSFCMESGWTARGWYTREYRGTGASWYRLRCEELKETEFSWPAEELNGKGFMLHPIKSYKLRGNRLKSNYFEVCVPEDFIESMQ